MSSDFDNQPSSYDSIFDFICIVQLFK